MTTAPIVEAPLERAERTGRQSQSSQKSAPKTGGIQMQKRARDAMRLRSVPSNTSLRRVFLARSAELLRSSTYSNPRRASATPVPASAPARMMLMLMETGSVRNCRIARCALERIEGIGEAKALRGMYASAQSGGLARMTIADRQPPVGRRSA